MKERMVSRMLSSVLPWFWQLEPCEVLIGTRYGQIRTSERVQVAAWRTHLEETGQQGHEEAAAQTPGQGAKV